MSCRVSRCNLSWRDQEEENDGQTCFVVKRGSCPLWTRPSQCDGRPARLGVMLHSLRMPGRMAESWRCLDLKIIYPAPPPAPMPNSTPTPEIRGLQTGPELLGGVPHSGWPVQLSSMGHSSYFEMTSVFWGHPYFVPASSPQSPAEITSNPSPDGESARGRRRWPGFLLSLLLFVCFRAPPAAHGGSQARGQIGAAPASLCQSHSNAGSEPRLRPTPQLTATPDPSPTEWGQGSNPHPHGY